MSCQEDMEAMVLEIHHLLAVFGGASMKRTVEYSELADAATIRSKCMEQL
ncbi:hypothetical protein HanXRQr2_Chr08g0348901 [Helianthus annuus]|uniref:Uncharacterized protein n=1 Tax=Helianthus annuus TaxID=4232 RepID=A0A9K3NDW5_HELAN|nr:hypothetical protein HanXRQr2_Chr08g0348901 [Helianthus annuus]KAJ0539585.1 hypothetical protein HanHA300_Chr08g0288071 [Helianthus annuus]